MTAAKSLRIEFKGEDITIEAMLTAVIQAHIAQDPDRANCYEKELLTVAGIVKNEIIEEALSNVIEEVDGEYSLSFMKLSCLNPGIRAHCKSLNKGYCVSSIYVSADYDSSLVARAAIFKLSPSAKVIEIKPPPSMLFGVSDGGRREKAVSPLRLRGSDSI
jgi:hypothetical protein